MTQQPTESLDCFSDLETTKKNINDYTFSAGDSIGMEFKSTPSFGYVMIDHHDRRNVKAFAKAICSLVKAIQGGSL